MAQLRQDFHEFERRQTAVIVVGPEDPGAFERYWLRNQLPFVGLPDPEHRVLVLFGQEINPPRCSRDYAARFGSAGTGFPRALACHHECHSACWVLRTRARPYARDARGSVRHVPWGAWIDRRPSRGGRCQRFANAGFVRTWTPLSRDDLRMSPCAAFVATG